MGGRRVLCNNGVIYALERAHDDDDEHVSRRLGLVLVLHQWLRWACAIVNRPCWCH